MVGYSDPCPCCGNKRRRSTLDRWGSWPRASSAAQHPPPAKFARSASDPTPSAVAAAVKENEIRASPVPTTLPSTAPPISSPGCPTPAPPGAGTKTLSTASDPSPSDEAETKAKVPIPVRCPPTPGIAEKELNAKEEEEKEEAEEEEEKKKKKKEKKEKEKMEAEMTGAPRRESEKKEEKEGVMKTKAEIRVPEGVQINICFKCKCGNSEEVILP